MLQDVVNALSIGCIYALVAVGLTLIYGILDIVNFAHGELYMLGGFAAWFAAQVLGLPYLASVPFAVVALALCGAAFDRFLLRRIRGKPPIVSIIATLGLSIALINGVVILLTSDSRKLPSPYDDTVIAFLGASMTLQGLLVILVSVALIAGLALFVKRSRMGKAMRAVSQDKLAATAMGIDINRVTLATVSIGSAIAAAAGALIGPIFLVYPTMGMLPCLKAFVVVIVGGMGSVQGAIYGGVLLGFIEVFATRYISSLYRDPIAFIVLILVLVVRPQGLFGARERRA